MNGEELTLVREIEKKYEAIHGQIQPCCRVFKNYCRCSEEKKKAVKKATTE
jgi:hypothetical protein